MGKAPMDRNSWAKQCDSVQTLFKIVVCTTLQLFSNFVYPKKWAYMKLSDSVSNADFKKVFFLVYREEIEK